MSIHKTEGIVIRKMKYGNSSKIVSFYTRDYGKVTGMARGARRIKNRFWGGLEPYVATEVIFYYKKGRMLQTIAESDICEPFLGIRNDLKKSVYAYAACELVDRLVEEENTHLYTLLHSFLLLLQSAGDTKQELLFWAFQLKLYSLLGYHPELDTCMGCGTALAAGSAPYFLHQGGIVCHQCRPADRPENISAGTVRLLAKLGQVSITDSLKYSIIPSLQQEGRSFFNYYYGYHSGQRRQLKALSALNDLKELAA